MMSKQRSLCRICLWILLFVNICPVTGRLQGKSVTNLVYDAHDSSDLADVLGTRSLKKGGGGSGSKGWSLSVGSGSESESYGTSSSSSSGSGCTKTTTVNGQTTTEECSKSDIAIIWAVTVGGVLIAVASAIFCCASKHGLNPCKPDTASNTTSSSADIPAPVAVAKMMDSKEKEWTPPAAKEKAPMVPKPSPDVEDDEAWNKSFEALKTYHTTHGTCKVPFGKETGVLRSWTERQKRLYSSSKLKPDRVQKMLELGFEF